MWRGTPQDTSWRIYHTTVRATINKMDDDRLMQEGSADMFHSDTREKIERVQNYGMTSVPLPRDEGGGQSGGNEGPAGIKGKAAEAIMMHASGGSRGHPVIIAIDDRRHRPRGLKPGESAQYDDQGQMTYIARTGAYVMSTKDMASLRHVNKQKQAAPQTSATAGGRGQNAPAQSYDHTGGTPNMEVRVTKDSIFVYAGGQVLAEFVKASMKVYLGGKSSDPMSLVMTEAGPSVNVYAKI